MPLSFRRFFKKCCVIIDCTEIFVEHVIGLLKQKYTILQSVLLISLIANNDDNIDESAIDKIVCEILVSTRTAGTIYQYCYY